jgi:zinc-binding in reverse transcriptase
MLIIDLNTIYQIIDQCELILESNILIWRWHSFSVFSTHSAYQWLVFRGIVDQTYTIWWSVYVPLKIKLFMWLVHKKKLIKDNLTKRGWTGTQCYFCNALENINTYFYSALL